MTTIKFQIPADPGSPFCCRVRSDNTVSRCPYVGALRFGSISACMLFHDKELQDDGIPEPGFGRLLRLPECLEAENG